MAAILFRLTSVPVLDANGDPVSGALANFYLSETLTRTPVYSDSGLSIEHTNPVEANSAGVLPSIYLDSAIDYRLILTDAEGVTIDEVDPYTDLAADALLAKLLSVDGAGSGLDADLLDGVQPSAFMLTVLDDSSSAVARATLNAARNDFDPAGINGDYTLVPADNGRFRRVIGSTNRTFTISPDSSAVWPSGSRVLVAPTGTGTLTIARGSGVALFFGGANANRTIAATGHAWLIQDGSADQWHIIGQGIT